MCVLTEGADPSMLGIKVPPSEMVTRGGHWVLNSASKLPNTPQRKVQSGEATNARQPDDYTMTLLGDDQSKVTTMAPPVSDHSKLRNVAQGATKDNNILRNKRPREESRRGNSVIDVDQIEGYLPSQLFSLAPFPLFLALTCGLADDGPPPPIKRQRTLVQPSVKHIALHREMKNRGISPPRQEDLFGDHFTSKDEMIQEFRSASAATQITTKSPYFTGLRPQKTLPTPGQKDRPIQLSWTILPDGKKVEKLGIFLDNGALGFISFKGGERSIRKEHVGEVQVRPVSPFKGKDIDVLCANSVFQTV